MLTTSRKFIPYEMKTSVLKIFSYDDKNLVGVLSNTCYNEEKYFTNITNMIFLVENLLDELSFPQRAMEVRSFNKESIKTTLENVVPSEFENRVPIATFKLNVMFRQNASWQGSLLWMDKGLETDFRSALELIFLIDSVLIN